MKKIIIVSDIHGLNSIQFTKWIQEYKRHLSDKYDIVIYDATVLASISVSNSYNGEEEIHRQFINGGIERAVNRLILPENKNSIGVGFSIGGTILWKAALKGLGISELICFSSTRIRYESDKPNCRIKLIFGQNDAYQPGEEWYKKMGLKVDVLPDLGHNFYSSPNYIDEISVVIHDFLNSK